MIIDAHTHIYPQKICRIAAKSIEKFYDIAVDNDGSLDLLLSYGEESGIDKFLVHSVATTEKQVTSINDFIANSVREHPDKLVGFMTLHPDFADLASEVDRAIGLGLKGIKLHPDFQKFAVDSKEAYAIYEVAEGRLPIQIHMGDYRYDYSHPKQLLQVLKDFPKLTVIGAHFAGWSEWEDSVRCLKGENLYVDTSSSSYNFAPKQFTDMIHAFGTDRVLFGSDYPMWKPGDELRYMQKLPLKPSELDKILYQNAATLLHL